MGRRRGGTCGQKKLGSSYAHAVAPLTHLLTKTTHPLAPLNYTGSKKSGRSGRRHGVKVARCHQTVLVRREDSAPTTTGLYYSPLPAFWPFAPAWTVLQLLAVHCAHVRTHTHTKHKTPTLPRLCSSAPLSVWPRR